MRVAIILLLSLLGVEADTKAAQNENILLSKVKYLTLRDGQFTKARRVSPVPQLKCVGGDAKGLYDIDVMRCKNMGRDYDDEDSISWSCTADLPIHFKLGSTDVSCEGYSYPEDPYVLKGSCGVEYRLGLTEAGYEKYGNSFKRKFMGNGDISGSDTTASAIFAIAFISVLGWILYSAWSQYNNPSGLQPGSARRPGFFNDGRLWFGSGSDDPPPPYDPRPPYFKPTSQTGGWTPGFGTGLAAGAAGAALLNSMRGGRERERPVERPSWTSNFNAGSSSRADSDSAERHTSTGFGQTRRR